MLTVNAVPPGMVLDTGFVAESPSDVAAAVAYLASDEAGWVAGQILQVVNGAELFGR